MNLTLAKTVAVVLLSGLLLGWAGTMRAASSATPSLVDLTVEERVTKIHGGLLSAQSADVAANRATLLWESGKYDAAIAACDRIMERWPNNLWFLSVCVDLRAQALACAGRESEAEAYLRTVEMRYLGDRRLVGMPGPFLKPRGQWSRTVGSHLALGIAATRAWIAVRKGSRTQGVAALQAWQRAMLDVAAHSDGPERKWLEFDAHIVDRRIGDLYRLQGDIAQAATWYQMVLDYLAQHPTPPTPLVRATRTTPTEPVPAPSDRYEAWRERELPDLIRDCSARTTASDNPLAWRRAVDYPVELGDLYRLHHNWPLAARAYAQALEYLLVHATTVHNYSELRDKRLPSLVWIEWERRVDYAIVFAKEYEEVGAWVLAAQSYVDALDFLKSHKCPQSMPEDRRTKYAQLLSTGLPDAISRCQEKSGAAGQHGIVPSPGADPRRGASPRAGTERGRP